MPEAGQFIKRVIWSMEHHGTSILARIPLLHHNPVKKQKEKNCPRKHICEEEGRRLERLVRSDSNNLLSWE